MTVANSNDFGLSVNGRAIEVIEDFNAVWGVSPAAISPNSYISCPTTYPLAMSWAQQMYVGSSNRAVASGVGANVYYFWGPGGSPQSSAILDYYQNCEVPVSPGGF